VASREEAELAAPLAFTGFGEGVAESVIDGTAPRSTGWVVAVLVATAVTTARGDGLAVRRTRVGDGLGDGVGDAVRLGVGDGVGACEGVGLTGGSVMMGVGDGGAGDGDSAVATPEGMRARHVAASSAAARRARSMRTRIGAKARRRV